jgi:hypothetical protein
MTIQEFLLRHRVTVRNSYQHSGTELQVDVSANHVIPRYYPTRTDFPDVEITSETVEKLRMMFHSIAGLAFRALNDLDQVRP